MPTIPTRPLGRTDLHVTRLGYGAMEIRGSRIWSGRDVTDQQAQRVLEAVLDSGITFIDTANGLWSQRGVYRPVLERATRRVQLGWNAPPTKPSGPRASFGWSNRSIGW